MSETSTVSPGNQAASVRVRGTVQGVGFRPTVWRLAHELSLAGDVRNDGEGVLVRIAGPVGAVTAFVERLEREAPPLARVDTVTVEPLAERALDLAGGSAFTIAPSVGGVARTSVTADAFTCPACLDEVSSPLERRFRYPFANCTHCGPRFSIVDAVPYDRSRTSMARFPLCDACRAEYEDPADRRFHAQPIACHACGPRAWLERLDGAAMSFDRHGMLDDVDAAASLIQQGEIVAIRGVGGFHLACDATRAETVERLRARKQRDAKPFALMARDLDVVARYARIGDTEVAMLRSPAAPIVVLAASGAERVAEAVAPSLDTLGFMLPTTPLHHLLLRSIDHPVVMTSGNRTGEPQVTANDQARERLGSIVDYALCHDRDIATRVDDSVVRVMAGVPRLLRRARGFAPAAIALPPGCERVHGIVAFGGELKSTFCLVERGTAILSHHLGDLEELETYEQFLAGLDHYARLFGHRPEILVADRHPEYLSSKLARRRAAAADLPLVEVQHHHAHIASCLAENGVDLATRPVLGVALDGLGWGDDGSIWGGEFLLADYRGYERLGTFEPVPMLGGAQAIRQPWRSTYAHLRAAIGWPRFATDYADLELCRFLDAQPRATLDRMAEKGINTPLASSCGRLFDAVAAAVGLCRDHARFEGQGAMQLEAVVDAHALGGDDEGRAYPFAIRRPAGSGLPTIESAAMWRALLDDLQRGTPTGRIAARFHRGLAIAIAGLVENLLRPRSDAGDAAPIVALSGGCFQNRILLEETVGRITAHGWQVLTQSKVPSNDGGLALGQAAIAAAPKEI